MEHWDVYEVKRACEYYEQWRFAAIQSMHTLDALTNCIQEMEYLFDQYMNGELIFEALYSELRDTFNEWEEETED